MWLLKVLEVSAVCISSACSSHYFNIPKRANTGTFFQFKYVSG
jgi:hypothetical protein